VLPYGTGFAVHEVWRALFTLDATHTTDEIVRASLIVIIVVAAFFFLYLCGIRLSGLLGGLLGGGWGCRNGGARSCALLGLWGFITGVKVLVLTLSGTA
jgi:hypothetical protein